MKEVRCEIHDRVLVCPSCVAADGGRKGGTSTSDAKRKSAILNLRKTPNHLKRRQKKPAAE